MDAHKCHAYEKNNYNYNQYYDNKVLVFSYGDEYLEHFNFVLVIDDSTSFDDIQWMLLQALLFRAIVVGYEVRINVLFVR